MRETMFQGTAGYVTRMSGGVGGRGREAFSYPDLDEWCSDFCLRLSDERTVYTLRFLASGGFLEK